MKKKKILSDSTFISEDELKAIGSAWDRIKLQASQIRSFIQVWQSPKYKLVDYERTVDYIENDAENYGIIIHSHTDHDNDETTYGQCLIKYGWFHLSFDDLRKMIKIHTGNEELKDECDRRLASEWDADIIALLDKLFGSNGEEYAEYLRLKEKFEKE